MGGGGGGGAVFLDRALNLWDLMLLQVDGIRTELNCRTRRGAAENCWVKNSIQEFPGGSEAKDQVLSLLWLGSLL